MGQFEDDAAASGQAFSAEAICGSGSANGNIMLWNPYGSGKGLYLDALTWAPGALHDTGYQGADIRNVASLSGYSPFDAGHVTNKNGGAAPKGSVYFKNGAAPNDYPYNLPHGEFWTSRLYETKAEDFGGVPYVIQQGHGKSFNEAYTGQWIVTFHWRELDDPLGVVNGPPPPPPPPGALAGTAIGDMVNLANTRDGSETTYANSNGDTQSVSIGIDLGAGVTSALSRFVVKSPTGRSFCSASPARSLTWAHFYSQDGTNFSAGPTGSFTDTASTTQSVLDITQSCPSGRYHKIKLTSTSVADWRVAETVFYP